MSYQPITLGRIGAVAGMDHIGDAFSQALQSYQANQRMLAEKLRYGDQQKRQEGQDFQADYLKANALAQSGDLAGAQAIMAKYGAQTAQREIPGAPGPAAPPPNPMQGQAPSAPLEQLSDPNAIAEQTAAEDWTASANPVKKAFATQQAQNKRMAQMLTGQYGGQRWSIDPEAKRQERGQRLDEAFGQSQDPLTQELYPQMRPALLASDQGVDSTDVFKHIQGEKANRAAASRQAQAEDLANRRMTQQEALAIMRDQRSDENSRRMAMAILGAAGKRADAATSAATRGWNTQGEQLFKNYTGSQGYSKQVEATRGYENMLADLKSGNTALMMGGLGAWVKEKSGGSAVVTENEIKRYLTTSMPWTEELNRQFNYWVKGDPQLSPTYVQPFVDALEKTIVQRQRGIVERIGKGAQATFLADENPEIRDQSEAAYIRAISPLMSGDQLDEFIKQRKAQTAAPIPVQGKSPTPGKAPPPQLPKTGGGPPSDAIEAARRRLADPRETPERKAKAQAFLQEHGG